MNFFKPMVLASLVSLSAVSSADEEKKFTYEDFRYSVCVGSGDYSKNVQEKILKMIGEGFSINGDCVNETMFSAVARRTYSPEFITALLKIGADPDFTGKTGVSARMTALSSRKPDIANLFITQDCDYGRKDRSGETLLQLAFSNRYPEIAKKVLEYSIPSSVINEKGSDGNSVLGRIARGEIYFDEANVKRLAELGADFNQLSSDGLPLLQECFLKKKKSLTHDEKKLNAFIKHGADVNAKNSRGENALHFMAHYRLYSRLYDFVLSRNPDVNAKDSLGNTPLLALYVYGDGRESDRGNYARKLIDAGSDINAVNNEGISVLMAALLSGAANGRSEYIAENLIKAGVKTDVRSPEGHSVLFFAAISRMGSSVEKVLLERGFDLNEKDPVTGETPLITAILAENGGFAARLVDAGADVNLTDSEGRTALMALAFHYPDLSLAKKILKAGGNLKSADKKGRTAFDYLEDSYHQDDDSYSDRIEKLRKFFSEQ